MCARENTRLRACMCGGDTDGTGGNTQVRACMWEGLVCVVPECAGLLSRHRLRQTLSSNSLAGRARGRPMSPPAPLSPRSLLQGQGGEEGRPMSRHSPAGHLCGSLQQPLECEQCPGVYKAPVRVSSISKFNLSRCHDPAPRIFCSRPNRPQQCCPQPCTSTRHIQMRSCTDDLPLAPPRVASRSRCPMMCPREEGWGGGERMEGEAVASSPAFRAVGRGVLGGRLL
eukprot:365563-Chlamydomonas_euryale.AAC.3